MKSIKKLSRIAALCGFGILTIGMASAAAAQDNGCQSDADCAEGEVCEQYSAPCPAIDCAPGEDCPDIECEPETFGECVRPPITCETDADCPTYLSCVQDDAPGVTCAIEEGQDEPVCDEPEDIEPGPGYCAYRIIDCETDAECPSDFECIVVGSSGGCSVAPCVDGEECPEPECDEEEEFRGCMPRQIECETSDDCPSEWSCQTFESGSCGGGDVIVEGGSTDGGEGDGGEGDMGGEGGQEEDDCEIESISACIPPGFEEFIGGGDAGVDFDSEEARDNADNDDQTPTPGDANDGESSVDEEDASCTVNALPARSAGPGALLMLLAGLALIARRRRA